MFSSDSDPIATVPGPSAVATEARPGGAAPVGTPPRVALSGLEVPLGQFATAARLARASGGRILVVLVRDRGATAAL